jgi:hypothetical protein
MFEVQLFDGVIGGYESMFVMKNDVVYWEFGAYV